MGWLGSSDWIPLGRLEHLCISNGVDRQHKLADFPKLVRYAVNMFLSLNDMNCARL